MATLTGCDESTPAASVPIGAPPQIVGSTFDAYRDDSGNATNVPVWPLIVLRFDRVLASTSVSRLNYTISSGPVGNVTFLEARIDPVDREVVLLLQAALSPDTEYELHVKSNGTSAATALAAFDGALFVGETTLSFRTEAAPAPGEVPGDVADPIAASPCAAMAVFANDCTGSTCHGGSPGSSPVMGLDLSSPRSVGATAINVPSMLANPSSEAANGLVIGAFPTGLTRVRSGSSSESFLIYKLLTHRVSGPIPAPSSTLDVPGLDDATNARAAAELGATIPGAPMPNTPATPTGPGLGWNDLRTIRRWIDQGAVVPTDCASAASTRTTSASEHHPELKQ
jgi:hypothetical protein